MNMVRCVAETKNLVGEGPVWDADSQCLYWTDINGMRIYRLDAGSGKTEFWQFQVPVSALSLTSAPGWLMVAAGAQLLVWNPETGQRVPFAQVEDANSGNRLNDGAADPEGNFWVGSMRNNVAPDGSGIDIDWGDPKNRTGSLYRVAPDGTVTRQASGFAIPNTMVWTPDRKTLLTGDSIDNVLHAYDYRAASVLDRRVYTQGLARGVPDGSAMDEEGFVWNCRYFGGCLARFDPAGNVDRIVEMPVTNITNCAFGGSDLRTLFVTTALLSTGPNTPLAGGLFAFEPGVRGLPENRFDWVP